MNSFNYWYRVGGKPWARRKAPWQYQMAHGHCKPDTPELDPERHGCATRNHPADAGLCWRIQA